MPVDQQQTLRASGEHSNRRFHLSIIGVVGLPAAYGGFETLAEELVKRLSARFRIQVFCSSAGRRDRPREHLGSTLTYLPFRANGWQSTVYDAISMLKGARSSHTLLILGVSGCVCLPLVRLLSPSTRIVTHIDGIEWKRAKWNTVANKFLRMSEWIAVRYSHTVIADNEAIRTYVRDQYGIDPPFIAYGGDSSDDSTQNGFPFELKFGNQAYFLTICRIEPENNVAAILEAFQRVPAQRLVVVGNWNASGYGKQLRRRFQSCHNIVLFDPIYDPAKLRALRSRAIGCIHGHSAGGTNPTLVQAMFAGMPVLAFDVSYNRYTTNGDADYWANVPELVSLLERITSDRLRQNGTKMREFAERHYQWSHIARCYEQVLFPHAPDLISSP